jgi:hypothetical protein
MAMRGALILALALVAGCATAGTPPPATIHPTFHELRPVMVEVRVEATIPITAALDSALRAELIERNYSPIAPGARADDETGLLLVVVTKERAQTTFSAPAGTMLYRMETSGGMDDPVRLARTLLSSLPAK